MSKDTSITAAQEAEARYPVFDKSQPEHRDGNKDLRMAFVNGADWQALKDKQRIEELEAITLDYRKLISKMVSAHTI